MKKFLLYSGSIVVLYLAVIAWMLASWPEFDREGAYAMGFGQVLVSGALAAGVLIALGGALMVLWRSFFARDRKVHLVGSALALAVLGLLLYQGIFLAREPSYEEKKAAWDARELEDAIRDNDLGRFVGGVFEKVRSGKEAELARIFAAGPFTEQDVLRHVLATNRTLDSGQREYVLKVEERHPEFIRQLPYASRVRARSFATFKFGEGDPLSTDSSGNDLFYAFRTFHELGYDPEAQRQPKNIQPVLTAASQLSPAIRASASPLFLLLDLPYLEILPARQTGPLRDDDKAKRRSTFVLLRQRGLELTPEEKQDAELQGALRSADLAFLLE